MFVLMINNSIIYKLFKGFTSYRKPFLNILNTVTTGKTFQQSGKWDSFRYLLKSSAGMYESLDSYFFRTTAGIQSGPNAFDE